MILQALVDYYETLAASGKIPRPGWVSVKTSLALELTKAGEISQVILLKEEVEKGKKKVFVPKNFDLPAQVNRSSNVAANFLCDNSSYIFGFYDNGKPMRSLNVLPLAKPCMRKFWMVWKAQRPKRFGVFQNWKPEKAREHPALQDYMDELLAGGNLIFRYDGQFVHEDPAIRQAWQEYYDQIGDGPDMVCLATGNTGPVENIHPSVKGVQGAQSSGAALVSFNGACFLLLRKRTEPKRPHQQIRRLCLYFGAQLPNCQSGIQKPRWRYHCTFLGQKRKSGILQHLQLGNIWRHCALQRA